MADRQSYLRMALICGVIVGLLVIMAMLPPALPFDSDGTPLPTQTARYDRLSGDIGADAAMLRARYYRSEGDHQQALEVYTAAIKLAPGHKDAYAGRGRAYFDLKDYQNAITDFTRAIEIEPTDYLLYYQRGLTYEELGWRQTAITDFSRAIELEPEYALSYWVRGNAYYLSQDYDAAVADYRQYEEIMGRMEPFMIEQIYGIALPGR